jgi:hypothetical protein
MTLGIVDSKLSIESDPMKLTPLRLGVLALAFLATGCGDNFPKLLQAEMSLANEVADHMLKIVDEDTARHFAENYTEKLKNTWDDVQKRKDLYMKNSELTNVGGAVDALGSLIKGRPGLDKDAARSELEKQRNQAAQNEAMRDRVLTIDRLLKNPEFLAEVTPRHQDEMKQLQKRLKLQQDRIQHLIARLRQCPKLQEAREAPRRIMGDGKVGLMTFLLQ